jgi:signal transduction histidine kinase/PAS domain-containing protein
VLGAVPPERGIYEPSQSASFHGGSGVDDRGGCRISGKRESRRCTSALSSSPGSRCDGVGLDETLVGWREVTERTRIERAVRESDERLRAAVDTQLDPFAIYSAVRDSAGRVVDVRTEFINRAACEFSQITAECQLGRGLLELFPELSSSRIFELYQEVIETGEPFAQDGLELNALFGGVASPRHYDVRIVPDGDGLVVSCRDVTRRVLAERRAERFTLIYATLSRADEAIVRIRERLALFERVCRVLVEEGRLRMAWVGEIDEDGWIVPVAHAGPVQGYFDSIRISVREVPEGRGPTGIAARERRHVFTTDVATDERMAPWRDAALAREYRSSAAFPLVVEDRCVAVLTAYSSEPGFFDEEEVELFDGLAADLSFALEAMQRDEKRRAVEDQLRRLSEELEHRVQDRTQELRAANAELEAFSYSVSHDLRAPLRAIDGFSQMVLGSYADTLDANGRHALERVRAGSERMGVLIDSMLELSRLGRRPLDSRNVDLSALAAEVVEELRAGEPERDVEVVIEPNVSVVGDKELLRVALQNLLGNAFKFTRKQPYASVQFGRTEHAGQAAIFVRDNGVGFDMNHADKLFLPFARLHDESEFSGTGIGLATVQRVIARHRGRVWAQGAIGDGATFYFTLAPEDDPRASARSGPSGTDCARDMQPSAPPGSSTARQVN